VSGSARAELEVLYRISVAVHQVVRNAEGSPHRADVVAMGADGTPTEELDRLAETEILKVLDAEGVDWNLLSEEIGHVTRGGQSTLVVDPIDGTSNALRNLPFSTVSLALGRRDLSGIDVGLVRDLHRGTTYWAARGQGAFRDGRPIRTRSWNPRSEIFFVNLGRPATERAARLAVKSRRIRSLGCASFEMLMVAQGSADGYFFENSPETRNLRATDVAAAYRILLEAGGGLGDAQGRPIDAFPLTVERRTSVFAWGDPKFRERAEEEGYL
jgi:fructose-1,6-bisphosphatase/inositol monophosphatase family enzyme